MKEILTEYDKDKHLYHELNEKSYVLIKHLLNKFPEIRIHHISGRVKEKYSLEKKINKKKTYKTLSDITDLSGIRIICYFDDDIDKVNDIIIKEFKLDVENSVDKRKLEESKFGYKSLHSVVELSDQRIALSEYAHLISLKSEIQIRTVLQHAWAEIEHDLGYKSVHSIPKKYKRDFNRIAALLEQADLGFLSLKDQLENYEADIPKLFEGNLSEVGIDKASVKYFLETNKSILAAEVELAAALQIEYNPIHSDSNLEQIIWVINEIGISNIQELIEIIRIKKDEVVSRAVDSISKIFPKTLVGMSKGRFIYEIWMNKVDDEKEIKHLE